MADCPRRFCGNELLEKEDQQDPLRELTRVIRRLSTAGSGQPALFPDENVSPRELVRDFDHRVLAVREAPETQLSSSQIESLTLLEQQLSTMARDGVEFDADIWTDEALRTSEHWAEVRTLAPRRSMNSAPPASRRFHFLPNIASSIATLCSTLSSAKLTVCTAFTVTTRNGTLTPSTDR